MRLPAYSVGKKVTTSMIALILVVVGFISFSRLGLDYFPDIEFPTVSVITTYSGAASEDIENVLTRPLEQVVSSVNRVKKVTSQTTEGVSIIMIEFEWGTNLDFAAQDVRDQIGLWEQYLPEEAGEPLVMKFNFSQFPIVFYGITGDRPVLELKDIIEDEVTHRLERIDGVAAARVLAMDEREILVDIDKAALEARGLSLERVTMALQAENLNMPAGNLTERHSEFLVRTVGEFRTLDDVRRTVIGATATGDPIYLQDIADVRDTLKETGYAARIQQQKGVYLFINKRSGANTALTGDAIKRELSLIQQDLPNDIQFHVAMDQSDMIRQVTNNTAKDAWIGGLLAIVLLFFFLRSWRPTLIIGLAIPLSIITTFIAFYAAGYTLNLLTLGGLALGIGMLVDNAIVVIENMFRHLQEGKDSDSAARDGASEVGMAITASTITTIIVFLPLVFAEGITGRLMRGLALSITFSLVSSLFVALAIVPMVASLLFKKRGSAVTAQKQIGAQFSKGREVYRKILEKVLFNRRWIIPAVFIVFIAALSLIPFMGTEFMPSQDRDMILLKVKMPVGTSLEETDRVVGMVEDIMAREPAVTMISAQVGSQVEQDAGDAASGFSNSGPHEGLLWVGLTPLTKRDSSDLEILEQIRRKLPRLENVKFEAIDISQAFLGGSMTPVEIKVFGRELDDLKQIADTIVGRIQGIEGLRDITHTLQKGKPEYQIHIDRERAYRLGLSVYQVANTVQTATLGKVATRFREGSEETDIRLRFKEKYRDSLDEIRSIPLRTPLDTTIYLDQVADIQAGEGPTQIFRENQARCVTITANISGRDLGSVVGDIKDTIDPFERQFPAGYFLEYGGSYEQMTEAFIVLAGVFALALLLVYMVMASQFEHLIHPFIIMFTIPLALVGVILALLLTGRPVNLPAAIGIILLSGIAVNNGIVMIDYINQLRRRGVDDREAILLGSATRLRPVLMTAMTTILGTLPMALSTTAGHEMRNPMAISLVGGLVATTFLTLFIIPSIYSIVNRISFRKKKAESSG